MVLHCPQITHGVPHRALNDIDCVILRSEMRRFTEAIGGLDYVAPSRQFNALRGDRRLIFDGPAGRLDVIIQSFDMCHSVDLATRLQLDYPTISATDLLITKLQVVELNAKDLQDIVLLLAEHDIECDEGDVINTDYIGTLVRHDWGLWRTLTGTLRSVSEWKPDIAPKAEQLLKALEQAPKSRRFTLRAKIGERKRWYELPDDDTGL